MKSQPTRSWTDAELAELIAGYFGDKLSPGQLERLVTDVSASLADQAARRGVAAPAAAQGTTATSSAQSSGRGARRGSTHPAGGLA